MSKPSPRQPFQQPRMMTLVYGCGCMYLVAYDCMRMSQLHRLRDQVCPQCRRKQAVQAQKQP